ILQQLFEYQSFSKQEAYNILTNIATGQYDSHQIAAFMTIYGMRSIKVDELAGFKEAMFDLCLKLDFEDFDLVDLCGTGGDGKNTFNISTLASFVVAGAGYSVAKHGNVGVSSACGSSNVMEYFRSEERRVGEESRTMEEANRIKEDMGVRSTDVANIE